MTIPHPPAPCRLAVWTALAVLSLAAGACQQSVDPVGTGGSGGAGAAGGTGASGAGTSGAGAAPGAGGAGGAPVCLSPGDPCQEPGVCPAWDCYCNDTDWSFHVAQACTNYQCYDAPADCTGACSGLGGVAYLANLGCDPDWSCHAPGAPCFDATQCHGWECDCVDPGNDLTIAAACTNSRCVDGPTDCINHCMTHGGVGSLVKTGTCP